MDDFTTPRRAIFLDRDGTLIHDPGYLSDPEGVALLEGVAEGLRALAAAGFVLVVVTNQSGIARGRYTVAQYEAVAGRVVAELDAVGVSLLDTYYCPYHPEGTTPPFNVDHPDRKPADGMWQRAAAEHGLDLATSWSIGDGERDVVAGKRAGTRGILLAGGRDKWSLPVQGPYDADFVARDFREAVLFILRAEGLPLPEAPGAAYPCERSADEASA
ncbi:MAG: HAD family hydrolase [Planctomycetota bacterium]|nr:HAD family hydrolase [Planctomycetota bacterium]